MNCPTRPLQWAIFCRVIDNFGDIGVCWRLACDLAGRGHTVRLWLDDSRALAWMAPDGCPCVEVLPWATPLALSAADQAWRADVMVEAFGCDIAPEFIAAQAMNARACGTNDIKNTSPPVWINLEYLSAEAYVERCHALPSLQSSGPAAGWTKWFFYPGFTPRTGGLLREANLAARQADFDKSAWLAAHGLPTTGEKRVSLFCYEPAALPGWLAQLSQHGLHGQRVRLLVAAGRAERAVKTALKTCFQHETDPMPWTLLPGLLSISYLPLLTQTDYDHLLWACDLNFVRGEDSLVRALWAGKPGVWHIYPQADGAHHAKLQALMDGLNMPESLQAFHRAWNAEQPPANTPGSTQALALSHADEAAWQAFAGTVRTDLAQKADLASQLIGFVASKKS